MILRFSLLYLDLLLFLLISLSEANPLEKSYGVSVSPGADTNDRVGSRIIDDSEYSDFEDDDSDSYGLMTLIESSEKNINSIMHLHKEKGEILVPCFGMWWPVGGGGVSYDYVGDYYGDYKKKRRRSRKQKKAAKMKKKKS